MRQHNHSTQGSAEVGAVCLPQRHFIRNLNPLMPGDEQAERKYRRGIRFGNEYLFATPLPELPGLRGSVPGYPGPIQSWALRQPAGIAIRVLKAAACRPLGG